MARATHDDLACALEREGTAASLKSQRDYTGEPPCSLRRHRAAAGP